MYAILQWPAHSKCYGGHSQASQKALRKVGMNGELRHNEESSRMCDTPVGTTVIKKGAGSPHNK